MKVVILAGGYGTRLFEETISKPKPMVNIGGMPILWHLMKIYSYHGFNEFVICLGYKKEVIIEYFYRNFAHIKNISGIGGAEYQFENSSENWKISLVDTGADTMTGGRLKKVSHIIGNSKFLLSYGDTICNVNLKNAIKFHNKEKAIVTLTAVQPKSNYGVIVLDENSRTVNKFVEKPIQNDQWINGGFYVMEPEIFSYIETDSTSLELEPFTKVVKKHKLSSYKHRGFWKSIETYKDKVELEEMWANKEAKWNIWEHNLGKAQ